MPHTSSPLADEEDDDGTPRRRPKPAQPVIRGRLRADGWTAARQRTFIEHLAGSGCVSHAAAAAGMSKQSAYALRRRMGHSAFAMAWKIAISLSRDMLLDEATERAMAGRELPVWHGADQVGTRIVHNDRLLMFLLTMKRDPIHPVLREDEVLQLWPTLLAEIDAILPPPIDDARLARALAGPGE